MTIPASEIVQVNPGVLPAGGSPLSLNAVFLTNSIRVPIGTVQPFANLQAVKDFFGSASVEATLAGVYFLGFEGSTTLPGTLYFAQFNTAAVAAYLRSGSQAGVTLTQLQLLSGTLTIVINGVSTTSASINLSGATSFSNAAALIQAGLLAGTPSSTATVTFDSQLQAFVITSPTTGGASTIAFAATSALATGLKLTQATGAVLSQGAAIATPDVVLGAVTQQTQNWVSFATTFEPDLAGKQAFATWTNAQNKRYLYSAWDTDTTAQQANASGTFGALTKAAAQNGIASIWNLSATGGQIAAFLCGAIAALNPSETNGRATFAFRRQGGLPRDVVDATIARNLRANGYNFYADYATAAQQFRFFQHGEISGDFAWIDSYVGQIYLNSQLQLALVLALQNNKSIPYNQDGYQIIRSACMGPINEALNFGTIRAGVTLSDSQIAQVNADAGVRASDAIMQLGYYLSVKNAAPSVRAVRGSPPITLYYADGQSIQQISLASIALL